MATKLKGKVGFSGFLVQKATGKQKRQKQHTRPSRKEISGHHACLSHREIKVRSIAEGTCDHIRLAEREGFEPSVPLRIQHLSRVPPSTSRPSLLISQNDNKRGGLSTPTPMDRLFFIHQRGSGYPLYSSYAWYGKCFHFLFCSVRFFFQSGATKLFFP